MGMTNAEIVLAALKTLAKDNPRQSWFTSREVMWQVRRDGYQMTTARARGIGRVLCRAGEAVSLVDRGHYSFQAL